MIGEVSADVLNTGRKSCNKILNNDSEHTFTMANLYRRIDEWLRSLPRVKYAVIMGIVAFVTYLGVGALLGESVLIQAVAMGLTLGAFYYFTNVR
ncbi:hypothetical protein AUR66_18400 [Haloferax profundi]|uniref:Uncharacterized protein n=2 Tax=Haloferax profundi TaxID=1544718 RepID=A0A0W1RWR6_9EURY|nr:hypothetical protein AUR66_18400 [Haloferax profundi]